MFSRKLQKVRDEVLLAFFAKRVRVEDVFLFEEFLRDQVVAIVPIHQEGFHGEAITRLDDPNRLMEFIF